jgi:hypothetical protein
VNDLRDRLQELADAATREGATPGPAHAIRRGRQRRRRMAAGIASLLAVALVAGAVGTGRLAGQPPPGPAVAATPPSTTLPPFTVRTGPVPGGIPSQLWEDTKTALGECGVRNAAGPRLIAHGTAYGHSWILGARPPRASKGMCWASGEADPRGGESVGASGSARSPSRSVVASGSAGATFGSVNGYVTKEAVKVRVLFKDGRPPRELVPFEGGPRFPVNFYLAYYPLKGRTQNWVVAQVLGLDRAGRVVARCRTGFLPNDTCAER